MFVWRNCEDEPRNGWQLPELDHQWHSWAGIRQAGKHHGQLEKAGNEPAFGKLWAKVQQQRNFDQRLGAVILAAQRAEKQTAKESPAGAKTFPRSGKEIAAHDIHQNNSQAHGVKGKVIFRNIFVLYINQSSINQPVKNQSLISQSKIL